MTTVLEFPDRGPADPPPSARRGRVWRAPQRVWIRRTWVRFESPRDTATTTADLPARRAA